MGTIIIPIWQGDFGYNLIFNLQDAQGNPFSLSGASSVYFRAQIIGLTKTKINAVMTIMNAAEGIVIYTPSAGDFTVAGEYPAQIQCNFSTSQVLTFGNLQMNVGPKIPY